MITRYALFEGQVHPGQNAAFREAVLTEILPKWKAFPGALADLEGRPIKIWHAEPVDGTASPGQVISVDKAGIVVACGEGGLRLTELQKAGGKRLPVEQFLAGTPITVGARFTVSVE